MSHPKSILFVAHDLGFFVSHRLPIAVAAKAAGYRVAIAGPVEPAVAEIEAKGIEHVALDMPRGMMKPLRQLAAIVALGRLLATRRPDLAHLVASKPVILGGTLARMLGIATVSSISGLGHVFIEEGARARIVRALVLLGYRIALGGRNSWAIFQNETNRNLLAAKGLPSARTVMIRGSGTDVKSFDPSPSGNIVPVVLLPSRMLWTKGIGEFCEAARLLKRSGTDARFRMVGDPYPGNPATISVEALNRLVVDYPVEWSPHTEDISRDMHESDIVVLPSYSEGFPKTLVDAAAAGRATVTSDIPGCRDAIEPGVTGLLAKDRDGEDLASKIRQLVDDENLRTVMGRNGRELAERHFAIEKIVDQHLSLYRSILCRTGGKHSV